MAEKIGRLKRIRGAFARWFAWNERVTNWSYIGEKVTQNFTIRREQSTTTFEEAVDEYGLTDADLKQKATMLWRLSVLDLLLFIILAAYAVFMFVHRAFPGAYPAVVIAALPLVQAVRHHFWYFQITERRLGCGLKEWFKKGILGRA